MTKVGMITEYWGARRDDYDNELNIDNMVKGVNQTRGQSELDHSHLLPTQRCIKHFLLVRF